MLTTIYKKPTTNIKLNGKKLKAFPLKIRYKVRMSLLNTILEVLANTITQGKGIKGMQIGNGGIKLSLFADDMIIYIENSNELPKNPPSTSKQL